MNKTLVLFCLLLIGFVGWREKTNVLDWKDKATTFVRGLFSVQEKEIAKVDSDTSVPAFPPPPPPPVVEKAVVEATPPEKKSAVPEPPAGVYYLTERVKVVTGAGIAVYKAGIEVRMLVDKGDSAAVTDGTSSFTVAKNKLTRDMAQVLEVRRQDDVAASNVANSPAATADKTAAAKAKANEMRNTYRRQIDQLDQQIRELSTKIDAANVQVYHAHSRGRSSSADASVSLWTSQRNSLLERRSDVIHALEAVPTRF